MNLKELKTRMAADYHPENHDLLLPTNNKASKYRSIIGSMNWLVMFEGFGIFYTTITLSKFSMIPREGLLESVIKI